LECCSRAVNVSLVQIKLIPSHRMIEPLESLLCHRYSSQPPRIIDYCPHLCTPGKSFRSVTHPEIAPGQARLTPEFFAGGLLEKKVYLGGMSILSILLSLEPGCHNPPPLEDRRPRRSTPSQECPLLAMFVRPVLAYAYRISS
jgi:hypothetical protein